MSGGFAKRSASVSHARRLAWAVVGIVAASLALAGSASAVEAKPGWEVNSRIYPTVLKPGGSGIVTVQVYNTGAGSTNGTVTVTDVLPPGLEATKAGAMVPFGHISNEGVEEYEYEDELGEEEIEHGALVTGASQLRVWNCSGTTVITCTTGPGFEGVQLPIRPGYAGRIGIAVKR